MKNDSLRRCVCIWGMSLIALLPTSAQKITGTWSGKLNVGPQSLRMVFHINGEENHYQATFDSPDQGAKGLPVSSVIFNNDTLILKLSNLNASYTGVLKDTLIEGTFMQNGMKFRLPLTQAVMTVKRPQTPTAPFPYQSEEVNFKNESANIRLAGTLTMPKEGTGFPAVVLISGSGPQNRDEELMEHKPFLVLADYLTRHGIAVLRYDDRGTAASEGNFSKATTADFKSDALAAVTYLKSRKEINSNKIGLIGHSEGGTITFMGAADDPQIAFIISLAGSAMRGDSILLQQNRALLAKQLPTPMLNNYIASLKEVFAAMEGTLSWDTDKKEQLFNQKIKPLKSYQALMPQLQNNLKAVWMKNSPWLAFFRSYDPQEAIAKTRCPILAINGSKDMQVLPVNLTQIEESARKSGNKKVKTVTYDGLNHLFQHCTTGMPTEYSQIEETISPEVLAAISNWILQTTK